MCVLYLEGLGGGSQLRHGVVVRQQVGQLAVCVQRGQRGQRLLQLADPLLVGLQQDEEEKEEKERGGNSTFVGCHDSGKM